MSFSKSSTSSTSSTSSVSVTIVTNRDKCSCGIHKYISDPMCSVCTDAHRIQCSTYGCRNRKLIPPVWSQAPATDYCFECLKENKSAGN